MGEREGGRDGGRAHVGILEVGFSMGMLWKACKVWMDW